MNIENKEIIERESWENFITFLEHDTYELRPKVYKIIRRIDTNFNKRVGLPTIKINYAKEYFEELWSDENAQDTMIEDEIGETEDRISFKELQEALKTAKNAKAAREDGIPTELYKYASGEFKRRLLEFLKRM